MNREERVIRATGDYLSRRTGRTRIDTRELAEIRDGADLVGIVREAGIDLKRKGASLVGLCPFHNDRNTPNLHVFESSARWKCFACGASGDALAHRIRHTRREESSIAENVDRPRR